ncbi:MAG: alpha/beta hydrolase [Flavobacteriales bacterium]|nr:alpha/beta hydrolase [Flavobacteriales bacterium]
MNKNILTANDWFNQGKRIAYNHKKKELHKQNNSRTNTLKVFHRIENDDLKSDYCITMLPGFPDGSFGWVNTENLLNKVNKSKRIYIEYVGQGDSDKPKDYNYSIKERANLVEAMWQFYGIKHTFIVTFDFSSLVVLELVRRQQENLNGNTQITRVMIVNGGLFADAHSHPLLTTPLLKTKFGKMGTLMAQKYHFAFNMMMKDLWSKEYRISNEELNQVFDAITRRNGAIFMHNGAGFVDEHKKYSERLDLLNIYKEMHKKVSFHIIGSEKDKFEPNQIVKAKERLGKYNLDIRILPGGHMTTSEHPDLLANIIQELDQ